MKICKCIVILLLGILLIINLVNIFQRVVLGQDMPMLFGYGRAIVVTGSMEPAIHPGDMVILRAQDDYETGDIVTYRANSYITHRVIEKTENGYITQGDANNTPDDEILKSRIVGQVVLAIPRIGYAVDFLKSPVGILLLMVGLFLMIELPGVAEKLRRRAP